MWQLYLMLILGISFVEVKSDHWGYPTEAPNGVITDSEDWTGVCREGRKQSPIDLAEDASVIGYYPRLVFMNYDKPIQNAKVRNTGHSIQIDIPSGQKYMMTGGGLPGIYILDQMHFHWASEHTINGVRYGLELHMVSHEQHFNNFSAAVKVQKGVAVLGILFHVSDDVNSALKTILDGTEEIKDEVGHENGLKKAISPDMLLPKDTTEFYRYDGSLTTPTCDEAVIWTVLGESIPFTMEQIEPFKTIKNEEGDLLTNNYRTLQRLNSRPLVHVQGHRNSSIIIKASLLILILGQILNQIL